MTWLECLQRLRQDRGKWSSIGRQIGLTGTQLRRLVSGETTRPRIDTVEKIVDYYVRQDATRTPERAA